MMLALGVANNPPCSCASVLPCVLKLLYHTATGPTAAQPAQTLWAGSSYVQPNCVTQCSSPNIPPPTLTSSPCTFPDASTPAPERCDAPTVGTNTKVNHALSTSTSCHPQLPSVAAPNGTFHLPSTRHHSSLQHRYVNQQSQPSRFTLPTTPATPNCNLLTVSSLQKRSNAADCRKLTSTTSRGVANTVTSSLSICSSWHASLYGRISVRYTGYELLRQLSADCSFPIRSITCHGHSTGRSDTMSRHRHKSRDCCSTAFVGARHSPTLKFNMAVHKLSSDNSSAHKPSPNYLHAKSPATDGIEHARLQHNPVGEFNSLSCSLQFGHLDTGRFPGPGQQRSYTQIPISADTSVDTTPVPCRKHLDSTTSSSNTCPASNAPVVHTQGSETSPGASSLHTAPQSPLVPPSTLSHSKYTWFTHNLTGIWSYSQAVSATTPLPRSYSQAAITDEQGAQQEQKPHLVLVDGSWLPVRESWFCFIKFEGYSWLYESDAPMTQQRFDELNKHVRFSGMQPFREQYLGRYGPPMTFTHCHVQDGDWCSYHIKLLGEVGRLREGKFVHPLYDYRRDFMQWPNGVEVEVTDADGKVTTHRRLTRVRHIHDIVTFLADPTPVTIMEKADSLCSLAAREDWPGGPNAVHNMLVRLYGQRAFDVLGLDVHKLVKDKYEAYMDAINPNWREEKENRKAALEKEKVEKAEKKRLEKEAQAERKRLEKEAQAEKQRLEREEKALRRQAEAADKKRMMAEQKKAKQEEKKQ